MELRAKGRKRIEAIEASRKSEDRFFTTAQRAEEIYANEPGNNIGPVSDLNWYDSYDFNILFSNVETIVPAIINSPPAPDIRRRYNDTDPVAKDVAEILERAIRCQIDDSRLQVEMERMAQDGFLGGRGLIRLRYKSEETEKEDEEIDDEAREVGDGASDSGSGGSDYPDTTAGRDQGRGGESYEGGDSEASVTGERICFEAVSWRDFRRGPARRWEDVPWIAFRHCIPKDDLESFADGELYASQDLAEDRMGEDKGLDIIVWEWWDKRTKEVWFIEENTGKVLKRVDDPLGLERFFPICDPVQPIEINGRLMPVTPFAIYEKLAAEVDIISMRIRLLTKAMKVKALYGGEAIDINNIVEGQDADLVPVTNSEMWAAQGGLDNMLSWWPVERFAVAIRELYAARDQAKNAIYEITGISDIIRGQGQASASATAENIKSQWGNLRIQKMQRMLERAARDLFVMMAEIIPTKFSAKTLQDMTGIQLIPTEQDMMPPPPPQPTGDPQQDQQAFGQYQQAIEAQQQKLAHMEAVNALLTEKLQRYYRIDVESDSTVRADLTRQKQEVAEFLQGAAAYFAAVGPLVMQGALPADLAMEVFAANSRMFNLGKSVEDAIDKATQMAKEKAQQPPPPNPEMVKAQMEQQKMQLQAQMEQSKAQTEQAKSQAQIETQRAKTEGDMAKLSADIEAKKIDADIKVSTAQQQLELDRQRHALEMRKIDAEIEKIRVGTIATVVSADAKNQLAERSQSFKESQASKEMTQ